MLAGLPKDVEMIVRRYVFEYNYIQLQEQYIAKWLSGDVRWDDSRCCFGDDLYKVANWRGLHTHIYKVLYRFSSERPHGSLPDNY